MLQTHKYIIHKDKIFDFFDYIEGLKRIIIFRGSIGNLSDKNVERCAALVDFDRKGWLNTIIGSCKEYDHLRHPLLKGVQNALQKGIIHQGSVEMLIVVEKELNIHLNIYKGVRQFVLDHPKDIFHYKRGG